MYKIQKKYITFFIKKYGHEQGHEHEHELGINIVMYMNLNMNKHMSMPISSSWGKDTQIANEAISSEDFDDFESMKRLIAFEIEYFSNEVTYCNCI